MADFALSNAKADLTLWSITSGSVIDQSVRAGITLALAADQSLFTAWTTTAGTSVVQESRVPQILSVGTERASMAFPVLDAPVKLFGRSRERSLPLRRA